MPVNIIPDGRNGSGSGPGSVEFTVAPEKLREASNRMAALANRLEYGAFARLSRTQVLPTGADAVSEAAASWFNNQINGGAGSGAWALNAAVANIRESAAALAAAADQYEGQDAAGAAAFTAGW